MAAQPTHFQISLGRKAVANLCRGVGKGRTTDIMRVTCPACKKLLAGDIAKLKAARERMRAKRAKAAAPKAAAPAPAAVK